MSAERTRVAKMANREMLEKQTAGRYDSQGQELVRVKFYDTSMRASGNPGFRKGFRWMLKSETRC